VHFSPCQSKSYQKGMKNLSFMLCLGMAKLA
jgi:hypothetical protein